MTDQKELNAAATPMKVVALTGSIAMGKSETARMFRRLGCPVFHADEVVHALYARGGRAVKPVAQAFPEALVEGAIDRQRLAERVVGDDTALKDLEAIVHPLVRSREKAFLKEARASGASLTVVDIPLLFETARDDDFDKIVVVSAPQAVQKARALARPGMTAEKFRTILSRQMPDAEKRRRAHFVVDTSRGLEEAFEQVRAVADCLLTTPGRERKSDA